MWSSFVSRRHSGISRDILNVMSQTLRGDVSLWSDKSTANESDYREGVGVDDCLSVIHSQNPPCVCSSVLEVEGPMSSSMNYPLHSTLNDVSGKNNTICVLPNSR